MFKYYQIRYFNEQTGYGGASYKKKTAKPMCEELKNMKYMTAYVEEMSGTSACAVFQDGNPGCSEKELKYINKNLANNKEENEKKLQRLNAMVNNKMSEKAREWILKRIGLLNQLIRQDGLNSKIKEAEL